MRWIAAIGLAAVLAGCGADGEPVTPTRDATITLSDSGLAASGRVGISNGPVSVSLGLGL